MKSAKDRTLAALAGAQHGVVTRAQLLTLGFTARRVDHRVGTGRLHPLHRGVYAELLRLVDFAELAKAIAAHPTHPGSPSLHAQLSRYTAGGTITRSELEERFLRLCDRHGLRRPETNICIEGIEVDFAWRDARLIVEVDGDSYHRSPGAFERDRERDVTLAVAGWRVMRFTHAQVTRRAAWVASALRKRLAS